MPKMTCVKCGCKLGYRTAIEWDVSGSSHRWICRECAIEEGLIDETENEENG